MMSTVHFLIKGQVQGVGFRRYVLHHAHQLNLRGFVCNLEDGDVECLAQGNGDAITQLEMLLRQGPHHSQVTDVVCSDLESESRRYNQFRII